MLTLSFLGPPAVVDTSFPLPLVPGRGRIDMGPRRGACNRHQILICSQTPPTHAGAMQAKHASNILILALHTFGDFSRVDDLAGLIPPLSGQCPPGVASLSLEQKDAVSIVPSRTPLSQAACIAEKAAHPPPAASAGPFAAGVLGSSCSPPTSVIELTESLALCKQFVLGRAGSAMNSGASGESVEGPCDSQETL